MKKPKVKEFYQIYKRKGENTIFIGVGPDKFAIDDPTSEMQSFLKELDGTKTLESLERTYQKAKEWVLDLERVGIIEDAAVQPHTVDPNFVDRWSRQINYFRLYETPELTGIDVQKKLASSRVVVVGTGAGGTTLLRFLNAVGIGTLEAVDFDEFEVSNLPTHATLDEDDVGLHKLKALEKHLLRQNSNLRFIPHNRKIQSDDELAELVKGADFFCAAFDRPRVEAARWSNAAALNTGVPMASIGATDKGARVGPIIYPGKTSCLECVGINDQIFLRSSERGALMGTTVAMLAGIMVNEIVKVITGYTESALLGRSLYINTGELSFSFTDHRQELSCRCANLMA